jgi:RsiW-degrading membrane proteinase PrsW (M82 family)
MNQELISPTRIHKRETKREVKRGLWWRILLVGMAFYLGGAILLFVTGNPNLFPTVVLLGSFMVPATYVGFFYERRHWSSRNLPATALSFIYGGVMGVFLASILEPLFIQSLTFGSTFIVGLIEEFAKIIGLLAIARYFDHDSELDGLVLGAAAGMGFAALESTGYAFSTFMGSGGSLSATVGVILLRGLLSPLGHGTWTAILAAVLFRESKSGHFRINLKVIAAYLTVAVLHGLWDGLPMFLSAYVTSGLDLMLGQIFVGAIGLVILWRLWKEAGKLEVERQFLTLEGMTQTKE